ncbi:hypothetical protein ACFSL4_34475 [Streptomyces caeni]|uniref:Uncharacterized protein n=1 Tax=Streptomyces caeni TaxID=2307231 RepID=A0ABW4J1S3_9ACTN
MRCAAPERILVLSALHKRFYDNSLTGDVVIVKNSPGKTVAPDDGLNGWNLPWSAWTAGSAA